MQSFHLIPILCQNSAIKRLKHSPKVSAGKKVPVQSIGLTGTSCWWNESFSEKLDGLHQFVDTGIELLNQKENFFNHLMYSFTFNSLKAKKFFLQFLRFKNSLFLNIVCNTYYVYPISSSIILKILDKIWSR